MKTGYWQRHLLMMVTAGVVASGCMGGGEASSMHDRRNPRDPRDPRAEPPPEMTATATIEDTVSADGCSILVTIDGAEYAPDYASRAAIIARRLPSVSTVAIKYHLTGDTGNVWCGFGTHLTLPEIALVFVN
jgi:hypothetical protein